MIAVVDYEAGNLYNVSHALEYLNVSFFLLRSPQELERASGVILPGVGAARPAMRSLQRQGLVAPLRKLTVPFLGICLGMQLLAEVSAEDDTPCLGIVSGSVFRFPPESGKVPHMGWNRVFPAGSPSQWGGLLQGIPQGSYFYFVHSFYLPRDANTTLGLSWHGKTAFASVIRKDNYWGVQFHPERSGELGLRLLQNFCEECRYACHSRH